MPKKILIFLILIISFSLLVFNFLKTQEAKAGTDENVSGWAWSNMALFESDIEATGGAITYADGYKIHTFTSSGTFQVISGSGEVEYLVVAGGGAGGGFYSPNTSGAGGGGGGGVLTNVGETGYSVSMGSHTVTVGAGGVGAISGQGGSGGNSSFATITASGGGGGAGQDNDNGASGGSGGGGRRSGVGGSGMTGQGYSGGAGAAGMGSSGAGGGGGAEESGTSGSSNNGGDGGDGISVNIAGTPVYYGGGGGGGARVTGNGGQGGLGGGGSAPNTRDSGTAGADGLGGGGGGSTGSSNGAELAGGNGGSGIVIVRYPVAIHDPTIGWISFNCNSEVDTTGDGVPNEPMMVCDGGANINKVCNPGFPEAVTCPGAASCVNACDVIDYGVDIDSNGYLSGHAWSENIGWLSFNIGETGNLPIGVDPNFGTHLVQVSTTTGEVSGWARFLAACDSVPCISSGPCANCGGWDGWIKLGNSPHQDWHASGGQQVYIATTTGHFHGWAWGDDVVGWISFNCQDTGACGDSDYKVMTDFIFIPPIVVSNLNWSFPNPCAQSRIPTFTWDVDTTEPFEYQIRLCSDASCAAELVSDSGINSGFWAPSCTYCCPGVDYEDISFGGFNYSAQVRARHVGAEWLDDWTDVNFTTYEHCYPWVDFDWSPKPIEVGPDVDFEDRFTCYDVPIGDPCDYNIVIPSHAWTFPGIEGTNYECINPAVNCGFAQDPKIKFLTTLTSGSQVYLEVCDSLNYCCLGNKPITVILPLPEYREVRPRSQLDNFLARIAGIFR